MNPTKTKYIISIYLLYIMYILPLNPLFYKAYQGEDKMGNSFKFRSQVETLLRLILTLYRIMQKLN